MRILQAYECIFVVSPTFDDEQSQVKAQETKQLIEKLGTSILYSENWGKRKLAYEVKKFRFGYYFLIHFECNNDVLFEIDRNLKLSESVIKFLIVKLAKEKLAKPSPFHVEKAKAKEEA